MQPSSIIKVIGAFVAGVIVALGSALLYVRATDRSHPAVQTALIPSPSPETAQPSPVPAAEQPKPHKIKEIRRQAVKPTVRRTPRAPLDVAQNSAPPVPAAEPPIPQPAPTVTQNEDQPSTTESTPANDSPIAPPPPQPHTVTLQAGTNLVVRLNETLSTDHNYAGDTFRASLESPIVMDGFIIADKGSKVLGRVVNAEKAGRVEGLSDLTVALTQLNTTDGQQVKIETTAYDRRMQGSTRQDAAKIAGGAALGAIIGAIAGGGKGAAIGAGAGGAAGTGAVLLTRGKPAVLPSETRLTFQLSAPVTITEKLNF